MVCQGIELLLDPGMQDLINEEVDMFKTLILKAEGKPFDCISQFNLPILNALWKVAVGDRFEYDDKRLASIMDGVTIQFRKSGTLAEIMSRVFPWITLLFPKFAGRDKILETTHDIVNLIKKSIKEHDETLDVNAPRDFIDKFLVEMKNTRDPSSSFFGERGMTNLANTLFDLFFAGSETTSSTLSWAMLFMAR